VLPEIVTGRLYDLALAGVRASDGTPPLHTAAYYTVNRRRP
jgi:hypothetical protein